MWGEFFGAGGFDVKSRSLIFRKHDSENNWSLLIKVYKSSPCFALRYAHPCPTLTPHCAALSHMLTAWYFFPEAKRVELRLRTSLFRASKVFCSKKNWPIIFLTVDSIVALSLSKLVASFSEAEVVKKKTKERKKKNGQALTFRVVSNVLYPTEYILHPRQRGSISQWGRAKEANPDASFVSLWVAEEEEEFFWRFLRRLFAFLEWSISQVRFADAR